MVGKGNTDLGSSITRRTALLAIGCFAGATGLQASVAAATPSTRETERAIHDEINARRSECGLSELSYDEELASDARTHSQAMAARGFFSHTAPGESSFSDHYDAACSGLAENIAYRTTRSEDPRSIAANVVDQWMGSAGHRRNVLGEYESEGLGVAFASDGTLYATEALGSGCATGGRSGGDTRAGDGPSDGDESNAGGSGDAEAGSGSDRSTDGDATRGWGSDDRGDGGWRRGDDDDDRGYRGGPWWRRAWSFRRFY